MKKIIFILMIIASIVFASCNAPTEVKIISSDETGLATTYAFNDFFNPNELVHFSNDTTSMAIVMDKNTGVLYIWKRSGYQWGMSPIYDSYGSVLTKEKWLARQAEKEVNCEKSKD